MFACLWMVYVTPDRPVSVRWDRRRLLGFTRVTGNRVHAGETAMYEARAMISIDDMIRERRGTLTATCSTCNAVFSHVRHQWGSSPGSWSWAARQCNDPTPLPRRHAPRYAPRPVACIRRSYRWAS